MAYDPTFQSIVFPLLRSLFELHLASVYSNRLYYLVNPNIGTDVTFPYCVYQSQDMGGKNVDAVAQNGWRGLITFRSIAEDQEIAATKLTELVQITPSITHVDYDIKIRVVHPMPFPVERRTQGNVYTEGIIIEFEIYPK